MRYTCVSLPSQLAADVIFFTFAVVFGVSRLYIFPKYMVLNVWNTTALNKMPRLFFCSLLSTLLVLHVFWSVWVWGMSTCFFCLVVVNEA